MRSGKRLILAILTLLMASCEADFNVNYHKGSYDTPEVKEENIMIIALKTIPDCDFFWVQGSGIQGFKNGNFSALEIKAEKTEAGEKTETNVKPKEFYVVNGSVYLSADFQDGEEFVEIFFKQEKGKNPTMIEELPEKPEIERIIVNDGKYKIETINYQGQFVSDIYRISDSKFCGRNILVAGYAYGYSESFSFTGAFIDIQGGLPGVREPGLYFISDRFTSQERIFEAGRMWVY